MNHAIYLMLWSILTSHGVTSNTSEFLSKETCETAASQFNAEQVMATPQERATMFAMCVRK